MTFVYFPLLGSIVLPVAPICRSSPRIYPVLTSVHPFSGAICLLSAAICRLSAAICWTSATIYSMFASIYRTSPAIYRLFMAIRNRLLTVYGLSVPIYRLPTGIYRLFAAAFSLEPEIYRLRGVDWAEAEPNPSARDKMHACHAGCFAPVAPAIVVSDLKRWAK